jgi:hypothetical protein
MIPAVYGRRSATQSVPDAPARPLTARQQRWARYESMLLEEWTAQLVRARRMGQPLPPEPSWSALFHEKGNDRAAREEFTRRWPASEAASVIRDSLATRWRNRTKQVR